MYEYLEFNESLPTLPASPHNFSMYAKMQKHSVNNRAMQTADN